MKHWIALGLWLVAASAAAVDADAIVGTWATEDRDGNRDSVVEISKLGQHYVGTVVWVKYDVYPENDPKGWVGKPVVDRENPDPALRTRPILGIQLVNGLRFEDGEWVGGEIYAPRQGETYTAKAWLEDADTLKIRGYIGTPFLGRTVTWRRAPVPDRPGVDPAP